MSLTKVTYAMIDGPIVNMHDFGAIGDGVVDDTSAIQSAIDYAYSIGGATIIGNGTFKTTATINIKPYVKLNFSAQSENIIRNATSGVTVFKFVKPDGYVPRLVLGAGISNVTINGVTASNNIGIDISDTQGATISKVEIGNCTYGVYFNKTSTQESYFNIVEQCAFASCIDGIRFGGAANRNTFSTNTYTNCQVAYNFSTASNVSETNVFINENVEGCHAAFEWLGGGVVYGQTWIGLTVENPLSNGYICTIKDPGRQLFVNLGIIPAATPAAVDFYKINTDYSTLIGSKNSSDGYSYGTRVVEELDIWGGLRNKAFYGTASYTGTIASGASDTLPITVTGSAVGDLVKLSANKDLSGCILTGYVSSANTVSVRIQNGTNGSVTLTSVTITAVTEKIG